MEKRSFDQKYKFSVKNDMVCIWTNFKKMIRAYDFNIEFVLFIKTPSFYRVNSFTVMLGAVDGSTIQFLNFLAKGHST